MIQVDFVFDNFFFNLLIDIILRIIYINMMYIKFVLDCYVIFSVILKNNFFFVYMILLVNWCFVEDIFIDVFLIFCVFFEK